MGYIRWVQERFAGTWVCGLCEEAIKDAQSRLGVGIEDALQVHATFVETANADPAICIARSILQLLKKIMSSKSCKETGVDPSHVD